MDLPLAILANRPSTENAAMSSFFASILADTSQRRESCAGRVRTHLAHSLPSGAPPVSRVAEALGLSERTLRRNLAQEGTSYRALLDELRRGAALDLLESKRSVTEAAFLLGFSETSALSRAFRRWYGTSTRAHPLRPTKEVPP